jgi:hypothetical protein
MMRAIEWRRDGPIANRLLLASLIAITAAFVGCGVPTRDSTNARNTNEPSGPLPINWETPFYHGRILSSVPEAQLLVSFKIKVPNFGAQPTLIQVEDPTSVELTDRTLVFVYKLNGYGIVNVLEDARQQAIQTETDIQRQADSPPAGTAPGEFRAVRVRTTKGLLVSGRMGSNPNGRSLLFIEDGVHFTISGPTLTTSDVEALANML